MRKTSFTDSKCIVTTPAYAHSLSKYHDIPRHSSPNQLLAHLYWYLRQTKRKHPSFTFLSRCPAHTSRLFGNTVLGVEAVLEVLAVLVRGVIGEHLAVRRALERLEARLALD
jgi:hypothetical protein